MKSVFRMAGFRSRSDCTVVPYFWEIPHRVSPGWTVWTVADWAEASEVAAMAAAGAVEAAVRAGAGVKLSIERAEGAAFGAAAGDFDWLVDGSDAEGRTSSELRRMGL